MGWQNDARFSRCIALNEIRVVWQMRSRTRTSRHRPSGIRERIVDKAVMEQSRSVAAEEIFELPRLYVGCDASVRASLVDPKRLVPIRQIGSGAKFGDRVISSSARRACLHRPAIYYSVGPDRRKRPDAECRLKRLDVVYRQSRKLGRDAARNTSWRERRSEIAVFKDQFRRLASGNTADLSV